MRENANYTYIFPAACIALAAGTPLLVSAFRNVGNGILAEASAKADITRVFVVFYVSNYMNEVELSKIPL